MINYLVKKKNEPKNMVQMEKGRELISTLFMG